MCSVAAFSLPLTDWLQTDCPQFILMDRAHFFQGMPMAALSLGLAQPLKADCDILYGFNLDSLCSDSEQ